VFEPLRRLSFGRLGRMTLPADLTLRAATTDDVPAIAAMRSAVGWAVHEWALHAVIGQPHARCVVVTDADRALAGIGSGIAYGPLGFIGNMVVAEAHRRRGVGTVVLDDVAGWLTRAGCTRLELNATDDGVHLYARHGFASRGRSASVRLPRATVLDGDLAVSAERATAADLDRLAAYDRPRFGGDRRPVLELLLADPSCRTAIAERDGTVAGYAVARLDEPRLGPMVADTPDVAASLLRWAFEAIPGTDEMRLNLPPGNEVGAAWLRDLGVTAEPWEGRMARGADVPRRDDTIYQMTVGPLG
jgi:GNAT superfamily N-acetyltransferase